MTPLTKGKYTARAVDWTGDAGDMQQVFALRARCFGPAGGVADAFDAAATHILVERRGPDCADGTADGTDRVVVAGFRMCLLTGDAIGSSYAAQFYGLGALRAFEGPMLELGRFCIDPDCSDPDILRIAWAALTAFVDETGVTMLFGCSSFSGVQTGPYLDAFALLKARHLAPPRWQPHVHAPDVFRFAARLRRKPDLKKANAVMPPLLRTYLMMGGWVSDHAVIDHAMNTLHVFTALETGAIPAARKKLLRALV